jgi:hypothetical protein
MLLLVLATSSAQALEFGTGVASHRIRENIAAQGHGLDLRWNFRDARWSLGLGWMRGRELLVDDWVKTPAGLQRVDGADDYLYLSLDRRFYTERRHFFAGFGFMYRDARTCLVSGPCYAGSVEVSRPFCFHPSAGLRWRRLELWYGHCSTADIATVNQGEDVIHFDFYWGTRE